MSKVKITLNVFTYNNQQMFEYASYQRNYIESYCKKIVIFQILTRYEFYDII